MTTVPQTLARTIQFLDGIGLPCEVREGASGFIPGVLIENGRLLVDPTARVSGLLHEAGHLATLPGRFRHLASGNLSAAHKAMMAEVDFISDPDGPEARAALQCSDPEATAWAWAAGKHLGLAHDEIIQDDEYDGEGAHLRLMLSTGRYAGVNGLAFAGFCVCRPGPAEQWTGLPAFPRLATWLQHDFAEREAHPPERLRA